jgi:hypothetical protein
VHGCGTRGIVYAPVHAHPIQLAGKQLLGVAAIDIDAGEQMPAGVDIHAPQSQQSGQQRRELGVAHRSCKRERDVHEQASGLSSR